MFLQKTIGITLLLISTSMVQADSFDQSRQTVSNTNKQLKSSQQTINNLDEKTKKMYSEYKDVRNEIETYLVYNKQLKDIVESQNNEIRILNKSISGIEQTSKEIMPFMAKMIDGLESFIKSDYPFLDNERKQRVVTLRNSMKRADISVAAKYRQILEAYQVEIDYGNTIESYAGEIENKKVTFLKVGRIGLYYQSFDKSKYFAWNIQSGAWQKLSEDYSPALANAIKIAKKQKSPDLFFAAIEPAKDRK